MEIEGIERTKKKKEKDGREGNKRGRAYMHK